MMDKCIQCDAWLVGCPCCNEVFCPECFMTEDEMEESE